MKDNKAEINYVFRGRSYTSGEAHVIAKVTDGIKPMIGREVHVNIPREQGLEILLSSCQNKDHYKSAINALVEKYNEIGKRDRTTLQLSLVIRGSGGIKPDSN